MKTKMIKNFDKTKIYNLVISMPIIWAFSGQLVSSDSYKSMVTLSILSLIVSLWQYGYKTIFSNFKTNRWIQVVGLMLLVAVFYKEYNSSASNGVLRGYAVMLVALIALPKTLSHKITNNIHWYLLMSSSILLLYTSMNTYYWGNPRALWDINPIPYTTISATVAISSICIFLISSRKEACLVSTLSFLFSFNSLVIGLSRGPILALLSSFFVVTVFLFIKKHLNYTKLIAIILFSIFSLTLHSSLVTERVKKTEDAITTIKQGGTDTSIGARINLWRSSIHSIFVNPILGLGSQEKDYREELAQQGVIDKGTAYWDHYHNQYIDILVKQGFIGLIFLTILMFYPLTQLRKMNIISSSIVLGVLSTFWVASMTDIPVSHTQPLIMFIALISLNWPQEKSE
jgi:O-antigen ligase